MDAVKELAAAAGMEVPAPDPRAAERQEAQKNLRDVTEAAAHWFVDQLNGADGEAARTYIRKRGITDETRRTFAIGLAPDSRIRLRTALRQFPLDMLVESGMLIQPPDDAPPDRREPYDRFRGRLMIPIRNARGQVIAFGGRILGAGEPKYLNSPDTPIFDKGRILYNLDRAAPVARQTGRLIVVEGYMDVIALAQAGITEAVAPLGTALTEEQLTLAWRQVPVPILAFDGDPAGRRAAMRAAMRALPLLKPGFSLSVLSLPAGQDPDDVVRAQGADGFEALAGQAQPLVQFLWECSLASQRSATPEARAAVKSELMGWVDMITDRDVASLYRRDFLDRYGAHFFPRRERRENGVAHGSVARLPWSIDGPVDKPTLHRIIVWLMRHPDQIGPRIDDLCQMPVPDKETARLLDTMIEAVCNHQPLDHDALMAILATSPVYNTANKLKQTNPLYGYEHRALQADEASKAEFLKANAKRIDEQIIALIAWPEAVARLEQADIAVRDDLNDCTMAEFEKCRISLEELRARARNFAEQTFAL